MKMYEIVAEVRYKRDPEMVKKYGGSEFESEVETFSTHTDLEEAKATYKSALGFAEQEMKNCPTYVYIKVYLTVKECLEYDKINAGSESGTYSWNE